MELSHLMKSKEQSDRTFCHSDTQTVNIVSLVIPLMHNENLILYVTGSCYLLSSQRLKNRFATMIVTVTKHKIPILREL